MAYKAEINIDYDPENAFWLHQVRDGQQQEFEKSEDDYQPDKDTQKGNHQITALLSEWIEKQKRAYHDHNGTEKPHPVAVKDHQKYFSGHVEEAKPEEEIIEKPQVEEIEEPRQEEAIAEPTFIKDTRNELVGTYVTSTDWNDKRPHPSDVLKQAGFVHIGSRDLRTGEARVAHLGYRSQVDTAEIYQHPQLGRLEVYSEPEEGVEIDGKKSWQRTQRIVNPAPDFKPDLRNPENLSVQERIKSRYEYSKRFMSSEARYRWEERAKGYGASVEEIKQKTLNIIAPLVVKADIWVRVPPSRVSSILREGRLVSLSESGKMGLGKSVGIKKYLPVRENAEENMFALPSGKMNRERPIYGYLSDDVDGHGAGYKGEEHVDPYGTVAIKLKPGARSKTTFTFGDSLDLNLGSMGGRVIPSFVDDPKPESILGDTLDLDTSYNSILDTQYDYVETQTHGVSIEDIAEIVFHETPNEDLVKKLNRAGIKNRAISRSIIGHAAKRDER